MILALTLAAAVAAAPAIPARVDAIAAQAGLAGEILVAKGDTIVLNRGYGMVASNGTVRHRADRRWRLASITKQVVAAMVVQDLARQSYSLDAPVAARFGKPSLGSVTTRQLLTHHSGLANPDDTPAAPGAMPSFYLKSSPDTAYCFSKPAAPGGPFAYNNCDYLVASMWLAGGERRWPRGMALAKPGDRLVAGYVGNKPEPAVSLASFGTAGALTGTARDVFRFDRSLMTGTLLAPAALAELWKPESNGSYQALGQWVFPGRLKGCAAPKRIVQRDGEIGGVQTRNFIFPDDDLVVIVFTNRSSDDFAFGEVWEGKGFTYELLSAAACP